MTTVTDTVEMIVPGSARATLQVGIAALGSIVILGGLTWFAYIFTSMARSESGFAEGMAIIVFGLYVLGGFVVLAIGLLIPQHEGDGIQLSPGQRKLLAYGVLAPIVSILLVPVGATVAPPLSGAVGSIVIAVMIGLLLSGPLATLCAVVLKLRA